MRRWIPLLLTIAITALPGEAADQARADGTVEPGLLASTDSQHVIARFADTVPDDLASIPGLSVSYRFTSVPAIYARATPRAIQTLAAHPDLAYLEGDKPIAFELDSAVRATRADRVWDPAGPILDPDGRIVNGTGVGIAIVDTGLDGLHPDHATPGKVGGNWQVTPAGMVEAPYTSTVNDGHGTHVAGIAAGNGALSEGLYRGVAPGATLYSFNMFAGSDGTVIMPAIAFDWILQNGSLLTPPIRVVNNSWRCVPRICANAFNPDQLHNTLASNLAEAGIVVTWSAGNDGGDGAAPRTNGSAINPTPGIVSVANYKDERTSFDTGVRDNRVSSTSSRGDSRDPRTWPDVAAPGSDVISTWAVSATIGSNRVTSRNPVTGENSYLLLNGTSMAAPHVAGIAALMLQANPGLTASQVEYILKATSEELPSPYGYVRADPTHPWNGANYAEGHGLVDALAAVQAAIAFDGLPPWEEPEPIPESFAVMRPAIEVERTLYFTDDLGMSQIYPQGPPAARHQGIRQFLTYTSDPFDAPTSFDAVLADMYMGTAHEYLATTHASLRLRAIVERVAADGTRTELGSSTEHTWHTIFGAPVHRTFQILFPEVTLAANERISFGIILERRPGSSPAPVSDLTLIEGGIIVYTGDPSASRIALGRQIMAPEPGSDEACRTMQHCAVVGDDVRYATIACGNVPVMLQWHGPAGSSLTYDCDATVGSCIVPGMPGDPDGSCQVRVEPVHVTVPQRDGRCSYQTPDGARGGAGRCEAIAWIETDR